MKIHYADKVGISGSKDISVAKFWAQSSRLFLDPSCYLSNILSVPECISSSIRSDVMGLKPLWSYIPSGVLVPRCGISQGGTVCSHV